MSKYSFYLLIMSKFRRLIGILYSPKYLLYTNITIACTTGISADIASQIIEQSFTHPKKVEPGQRINSISNRPKLKILSWFGIKFEWDHRRTSLLIVFPLMDFIWLFNFFYFGNSISIDFNEYLTIIERKCNLHAFLQEICSW